MLPTAVLAIAASTDDFCEVNEDLFASGKAARSVLCPLDVFAGRFRCHRHRAFSGLRETLAVRVKVDENTICDLRRVPDEFLYPYIPSNLVLVPE